MTSFSLILVVLGVYSVIVYIGLLLLLVLIEVLIVKNDKLIGIMDYSRWPTFFIALPLKTILSTGKYWWRICHI